MYRLLTLILSFSLISLVQAKTIAEFTQGMQQQQGYFNFYYQQKSGKLFVEVDKLEQPFIFLSSLPQGMGSNDIGLDRGQLNDTRLVQFERYGHKVMLRQLNTYYRANSDNKAEKDSIDEAFADSILAGLPIVAENEHALLVDYTNFLLSDVHKVAERLDNRKQGNYQLDKERSGIYVTRSKAFPKNTELEATLTFKGNKAGQFVRQVTPETSAITVNSHHSLIALPDEGYQSRVFHPYSGYWKEEYKDYATDIEQPMLQKYIPRHRLQKKAPARASSEAIEPIVYYLDPGVPEPVRSALYEGAMWWADAFDAAGFKNAFQVKTLPADADPMDVRYNVIQWVHRATRGWSYGHSVTDPRTGEIIKGHVTLGSLRVRQDYLIALGLTSPFKQQGASTEKQKQMALARIRQLSAHEVGHTLGLAHNFAASANNRASVMDYPHPLVSIKDGKISLEGAYDEGIGRWDKYSIRYGYTEFTADEGQQLKQLVTEAKRAGLDYLSDPDARPKGGANPKGHLWDNGADPVTELVRLGKVRKLALQNMGLDSIADGTALSQLHQTLVPIYLMHRYQIEAAVKLIAGVDYGYELKQQGKAAQGVKKVSASQQQDALNALLATITPEYLSIPDALLKLITPKVYGEDQSRESFKSRTGLTFDPLSAAEAAAANTISLLLHPQRLNRLSQQSSMEVNVSFVLNSLLDKTIKADISDTPALSARIKHVSFELIMLAATSDKVAPEVQAEIQHQMLALKPWLQKNSKKQRADVAQLQNWLRRLNWFENTGKWHSQFKVLPLPPGSPI